MSPRDVRVAGSIRVEVPAPRLILTTLSGRTDRKAAEDGWLQFRALVATMKQPVWISDSLELTGFDPSTLALGARWFAAFRERGGRDCVVASQWPTAVMAASTMALGIGIRVRSVGLLDEAKRIAFELLKEDGSQT